MKIQFRFIFINLMWINICNSKWTDISNKDESVSYVFAPGVLLPETQMSKYLPSFISSTNEHISCSCGIEVINSPAKSCNFGEVNLRNLNEPLTINPIRVLGKFIKKIMCYVATLYNDKFNITITPLKSRSLVSMRGHWVDVKKINFAQSLDVETFREKYNKHLDSMKNRNDENNIVLYGVSRGAATIFNFVAIDKPQNVKAMICEGIFDSIPNILENMFQFGSPAAIKVLEMFTNFKRNEIAPIKSVDEIPLNLPILLVGSLKDEIVPCSCIFNLYRRLKNRGHKKLHIHILNNSSHNWYTNDKEDKELYEQVVHAFYKHYNLPHIPEFALMGEKYFLQKTQPDF